MAGEQDAVTQPELELVVTVVDDEKQNVDNATVTKTNGDGGAVDDDAALDLKQQLEAMRKRATSAESRVSTAERRAQTATNEVRVVRSAAGEAQYDSVVAGLDAAQSELNAATREQAEAHAAGEFEKAAQAQAKIAKLGYRVGRLEEAKGEMDRMREAATQPGARQPAQNDTPADPVEAYVANRTKPTADWLRSHSEFITDQRKNSKLTAAHFDAVGEGLEPDSKEYFEHVETYLGLKKEEAVVEDTTTAKPAPKVTSKRAPAAPVNPTASNGSGRANEVRLTKSEAEAAVDGTHVYNYEDPTGKGRWKKGDPIGIQEFARRKREMIASGHYDRIYTES